MKNYTLILIALLAVTAISCSSTEKVEDNSNAALQTENEPADKIDPSDKIDTELPEAKSKDAKASREQIEAKDASSNGLGPTDTMRAFNDAVIKKDAPKIRGFLSRASITMLEADAKKQGTTLDAILTAEDGAPMPVEREMQNEKIDGNNATVEVKNSVLGSFEPMFMVKEDGNWRVALDKIRADMIRRMNEMQKDAPIPAN